MSDDTILPPDENFLVAERRAKLAALRAEGIAFPNDVRRSDYAGDLQDEYADADAWTGEALEATKSDIGWGSQIRNYVLDQSRIKDLRTGIERSDTQKVLDGDLDEFVEASLKSGLEAGAKRSDAA